MSEFDPMIDGLRDAQQLASWLVENRATLDVSDTLGFVATKLVVKDPTGDNQWCIPLVPGIDMVDIDDGWFATAGPAHIHVTDARDNMPEKVEVVYTGIDDETRLSYVDIGSVPTFEPVQHIPNN